MEKELNLHSFLYQTRRYSGQFTPHALVFNANLQEFATRTSYICNLQTLGKLSQEESYQQIKTLWEELQRSYGELHIEKDTEN